MDSSRDYRQAWAINGEDVPYRNANAIPAFFNLEDHGDDEEVGEWMETALPVLRSQSTEFARKAVENLMFFKGVSRDSTREYFNFEDAHRFSVDNKVSINIIYEFVELWVNRLANFKASITVTPGTDDTEARDNAEAKKRAIDDFFQKNKVNELLSIFDRQCFTFGESYIYGMWDANKGPLRPGFEEIEGRYQSLKRVATASGEEVNIDRYPRIGDVRLKVIPGIYVYFENRPWDELDYIIIELRTNVDKLRSDHPDIDIVGSGDISEYHMYHLPTKYLQKGRFVKFAAGEVLENTDFPYPKPEFPIVRMTNIDITGASRAKSFIENIKSHQVLINQTISETWNNLRRSSKGKWVLPAKTANPRHLAPQSPAIEYYGNVPPRFIAYDGIKKEALDFIALLRDYAERQARIQGITQGTPPPNVRSGLQFAQLEEQEKRAVEITVNKKNRAVEELAEMVAMIMSVRYRKEDGRTVTIFGKDKEYLTEALEVGALKEDHPVIVKNDDGLPGGKMSQLSVYSELRNSFGENVIPNEMMIDMLDSGRFNQFTEFGGATVETTLAQMSKAIKGERPEPPQEYEDLILKWKIVIGTMRKRSFLTYSDEVKQIFKDIVTTIEDLIVNKPNQSPAFQERLALLQSFPVYYKPPTVQFEPELPPMGVEGLPPEAQGLNPEDIQAAQLENQTLQGEADLPTGGGEEIPPEVLAQLGGQ